MIIVKYYKIVYFLALQCIANGKPFKVPIEISKEFVKHAEEAVNVS